MVESLGENEDALTLTAGDATVVRAVGRESFAGTGGDASAAGGKDMSMLGDEEATVVRS